MGRARRVARRPECHSRWRSTPVEAVDIAVEAGTLARCVFHDVVYDHGGDPVGVYRPANSRFTKGTLPNDYDSRSELTDMIKGVVEEVAVECPRCDPHE